MAIGIFQISDKGLEMIPLTEVVPEFHRVVAQRPVAEIVALPPNLKAISNRVGPEAVVLHCEDREGRPFPKISIRQKIPA